MGAELLALQTGSRRCQAKDLFAGAAQDFVECACFVYLVRAPRRLILVDTGYGCRKNAVSGGCSGFISAAELLSRLDISPQQITDVVLTHAHESHIGALSDFKQARIYISVREVKAMREALDRGNRAGFYRAEDWNALRSAPRLHLIRNCLAIDEHLRVDVVGGHTRGFLLPTFMTAGVSRVMLASDNVPLYRHLQGEDFPPQWCDGGADVRERLKLRMYTAFVLPGCDPLVMRRYPAAAPRIARILSSELVN